MKNVYILLALLFSLNTFSQKAKQGKGQTKAPKEPEVYTNVDESAAFNGGAEELKKYMQDHFTYPAGATVSGKCTLKLTVDENGKIANVEVSKGVTNCGDCDAEAVRVVKAMPDWKPAKIKGKAVKSYVSLPVDFKKPEQTAEESSNKKKKFLD